MDREREQNDPDDAVADAVLGASRVLAAVAARSIASAGDDVTLPQYRALVVLASRGPQRSIGLSEALGISASTATRLCDRLEKKGFIIRRHDDCGSDRRAVRIGITKAGLSLLAGVTKRRKADIAAIVDAVSPSDRPKLVRAFESFAKAAGEVPDKDWPSWREM